MHSHERLLVLNAVALLLRRRRRRIYLFGSNSI